MKPTIHSTFCRLDLPVLNVTGLSSDNRTCVVGFSIGIAGSSCGVGGAGLDVLIGCVDLEASRTVADTAKISC